MRTCTSGVESQAGRLSALRVGLLRGVLSRPAIVGAVLSAICAVSAASVIAVSPPIAPAPSAKKVVVATAPAKVVAAEKLTPAQAAAAPADAAKSGDVACEAEACAEGAACAEGTPCAADQAKAKLAGEKAAASNPLVGMIRVLYVKGEPSLLPTITVETTVDEEALESDSEKVVPLAGTHVQTAKIEVADADSGLKLKAFTLGANGSLVAVLSAPAFYGDGAAPAVKIPGMVRVMNSTGKMEAEWQLDFAPEAVRMSKDGVIFVAGGDDLYKFTADGKLLAKLVSPHISAILADKGKLRSEAQARIDANVEVYREQIKQFEEKTAKIEKIEEPTKRQKRQLASLKEQIKLFEQMAKTAGEEDVNAVVEQMIAEQQRVHAMAVSDKDIFLAVRMAKGYGFSVWRSNLDGTEPVEITTGLSGCCGQMDIQCIDDCVFVAENSKKRVVKFTRDGKKLTTFGKGGREGQGESFGGCCNPMNLCFDGSGQVYTSESEGFVKRFSSSGEFLGMVGQAKADQGGCKNVSLQVSPDLSKVYFYDLNGSSILVLEPKGDVKEELRASASLQTTKAKVLQAIP